MNPFTIAIVAVVGFLWLRSRQSGEAPRDAQNPAAPAPPRGASATVEDAQDRYEAGLNGLSRAAQLAANALRRRQGAAEHAAGAGAPGVADAWQSVADRYGDAGVSPRAK